MLLKCLSLPYYETFYQYCSYHFVLGIIFVPGVKVFVQSTLMKIGLFSPKFNNEPKEATTAAYTMQLKDEKGVNISLEDLKGKVVL